MKDDAMEERIIQYLDHLLTPAEVSEFEHQLSQDQELRELLEIIKAERDIDYILMENFIRQKVEHKPIVPKPGFKKPILIYMAILVILVVLVAGIWVFTHENTVNHQPLPIHSPQDTLPPDHLQQPVIIPPSNPVVTPQRDQNNAQKMAMLFQPAFKNVLDSEPSKGQNSDVFETGIIALKAGNYKAAKSFFKTMEKQGLLADNSRGNFFLGYALFSLKEYKSAAVYFEKSEDAAFVKQSRWMAALTRLATFGENDNVFKGLVKAVSMDEKSLYQKDAQRLIDSLNK